MSLVHLDRDELEASRGGLWDYVSPSRLNLWLKCPLAFKLKYIDGVPSPLTPSLLIGIVVHRGLEFFYRHRLLAQEIGPRAVVAYTAACWDEQLAEAEHSPFASLHAQGESRAQALGMVRMYLTSMPADEPRPSAVEVPLSAPLIDPYNGEDLGIPLVGILDLVLPDEGGARLIDFKTSSRAAAPLEILNEVQLTSYAWLYRQAHGQTETGVEIRQLVRTKELKLQRHPYVARRESHIRRLFAVIRAYLDDLQRGRFVFRPGLACSYCEHRESHCRFWTP